MAEAIEAGRQIEKLYIRKGAEGQLMTELKDLCIRHRVRMQEVLPERQHLIKSSNALLPLKINTFTTIGELIRYLPEGHSIRI